MTHGTERHRSYTELLAAGQPRSITSDEEADRIQKQIDALIDKGQLTQDEEEYLSLLGDLVAAWEEGRYQWPKLSPVEMLRILMEDNGLRQADLVGSVFPTASIASEVLNGKRNLTYEFVERLTRFFHTSPAVFFEAGLEREESEEPADQAELTQETVVASAGEAEAQGGDEWRIHPTEFFERYLDQFVELAESSGLDREALIKTLLAMVERRGEDPMTNGGRRRTESAKPKTLPTK